MCIPHIWMTSRPFDSAQNISYWQNPWLEYFSNESDLFLVYANNDRFLPISLWLEKKPNPFEMVWRSSLAIALVTAQRACCLVWRGWPPRHALLSAALRAFTGDGHCMASLMHRGARADRFHCTQLQRTVASHSNCISAHRGNDPAVHITVAEAHLAAMEGEMGKGSPPILIWANNTAPVRYEHPLCKNVFRMTEPPCLSLTEDSEFIKITNCTCQMCNLSNVYLMRRNMCKGVFLSKSHLAEASTP